MVCKSITGGGSTNGVGSGLGGSEKINGGVEKVTLLFSSGPLSFDTLAMGGDKSGEGGDFGGSNDCGSGDDGGVTTS